MPLTTDTADQVVQAVENDLVSCARIEGPTLYGVLSKLHIAGHLRNLGLIFGGMSTKDSTFVRVCCIGIAAATTKAIFAGIMSGDVTDAKATFQAYRIVHGFAHHGTGVAMKDGNDYVFDWFPTLEPSNPVIYRLADWRRDTGGVDYEDFDGFDW